MASKVWNFDSVYGQKVRPYWTNITPVKTVYNYYKFEAIAIKVGGHGY